METQYKLNQEIERESKTWVVTNVQDFGNGLQSVVCNLKTKKGLGKTMGSFINDRFITGFKVSRV
jgi:UTP-glucose-1-phosphate uridylyltransferase